MSDASDTTVQPTVTAWDVVLLDAGESPIECIRALRELTGKELRPLEDCLATLPETVLRGVPQDVAEAAQKRLTAAGAQAEVKPADVAHLAPPPSTPPPPAPPAPPAPVTPPVAPATPTPPAPVAPAAPPAERPTTPTGTAPIGLTAPAAPMTPPSPTAPVAPAAAPSDDDSDDSAPAPSDAGEGDDDGTDVSAPVDAAMRPTATSAHDSWAPHLDGEPAGRPWPPHPHGFHGVPAKRAAVAAPAPGFPEGHTVVEITHGQVVVENETWLRGPKSYGGAYPKGAVLAMPAREATKLVALRLAKLASS